MSLSGPDTGMTARNLAIVWAPNLLRPKKIDIGTDDSLKDIGAQAVCTEFIINNSDRLFSDGVEEEVDEVEEDRQININLGSREVNIDQEVARADSLKIQERPTHATNLREIRTKSMSFSASLNGRRVWDERKDHCPTIIDSKMSKTEDENDKSRLGSLFQSRGVRLKRGKSLSSQEFNQVGRYFFSCLDTIMNL